MNQPQNMEEIPQGGSHVLDITFLTHVGGSPINPDGYTAPDDPSPLITPAWYIYDESGATYNLAPVDYNPPSVADLRYGGSTGRFLITPVAQVGTILSSDLDGERWAIGWTATINGITKTFFEFVTIVEPLAAEFGTTGYVGISDVREDVGQLTKDEIYTISATGPAVAGSITLPDNATKQIVAVSVNGVELTSGWAFKKPARIEFSPALTVGDYVEISRDTFMTDAQVNLQIVAVCNYINGQLSKAYTFPFEAPYPPLLVDLALKLTSAEIRMKLFDSTDTQGDRRGQAQWDRWNAKLMELKDGSAILLDADGNLIDIVIQSGIFIDNQDEAVFSMDDVPDINEVSTRTGYRRRRYGF